MGKLALSVPRPARPRSLLLSLGVSAMLLLGALNPAPLSAATPRAADLKDVARKDTLVISGFGSGLTEISGPAEHEPVFARRAWGAFATS